MGKMIIKIDFNYKYDISSHYRSWKMRLILAPPLNSFVLTSAEPEPSIVRSKSD